ncbi:MAG: hypothetical protein J6K39_03245 [Clostridia bacterium]|nr:hypothetical protein [Clostridia bacterium]
MSKLNGLISIARKAGFCVIGQDNLKGFDKKLHLIVLDKSAGDSLVREMTFLSNKKNCSLLTVDGLEEVTAIKNCKVIGIKNKDLSEMIEKEIKGE